MPEKDDLDLLLDSALATYADPGPESASRRSRTQCTQSGTRSRGAHSLGRPQAAPRLVCMGLRTACRRLHAVALALDYEVRSCAVRPDAAGPTDKSISRNSSATAGTCIVSTDTAPPFGARRSIRATVYPTPRLRQQYLAIPKLDVFPTPQPMSYRRTRARRLATADSVAVAQSAGRGAAGRLADPYRRHPHSAARIARSGPTIRRLHAHDQHPLQPSTSHSQHAL